MKIKRYILLLAAAAGLAAACQKQEMVMLDVSQAIAPVMHDIDSAGVKNQMIITAENQASKVTFTWDAADFGAPTQVDYSIEVAVGDGPKHVVVSGITTTDASNTYEAVNQVLFNGLELKENVLTDVNFYVGASVGSAATLYSAPVPVKVSCTAADKQYPKIYVLGEFNSWKHDRALYLFDFAGDDAEYQGVIDFGAADRADGGFKITPNADWNAEWGLDADQEAEADETVLLTAGGSNINIYQLNRYYHFSLDKKSGTLKKNNAFNSVSVIGSALSGWEDGKDVFMEFDATTQKFYADVTLSAGEIKFRADTAWTLTWGTASEGKEMNKGVLDGDKNITVPAGNYRIYLNINNLKEPSFVLNADKYGAEAPVVPGNPELSGEKRTVYFKPSSDWTGEGITFYAWIWPTDGDGSWYEMTDEDGDGTYEVEFPKEYSNIIFASMNGEPSWDNKVEQTDDLLIPSDGKETYILASSTWMDLSSDDNGGTPGGPDVPDVPEVPEGEGTVVYYRPSSMIAGSAAFAVYCWNDAGDTWIAMTDSDADGIYAAAIPYEYANIIFTAQNSTSFSWDSKVSQTADLTVPSDDKNAYVDYTATWETLADAKAFVEPSEVCKLIVKVTMDLDWYDKYIYSWTAGATTAAWPGSKMEYVGEEGNYHVYFYNFPYSLNGKKIDFVVSDGNGSQTIDLSVVLNGTETTFCVEVSHKK